MVASSKHALIVGSGVVGTAIATHIDTLPDWRCTSVSRSERELDSHIALNLESADACESLFSKIEDFTHVFYVAHKPDGDAAAEGRLNLTMFSNIVGAADKRASLLRHVHVMQGSKWYGSHIGRYKTPARELDPRHPQSGFYQPQQVWLQALQVGRPWTWSALRPHGIWGFAERSSLSPLCAIATYATLMKYLGLPLYFPGRPGAYEAIYQCTDAKHLARGMVWASTNSAAANQVFNLTNGDFIRWSDMWPHIANWFRMSAGPVIPMSITQYMADKQSNWNEITDRFGLRPSVLLAITSYEAAERYIFNADWDQMSSTTKIRQAGFSDAVDTYEMVARQFAGLVERRLIPDPKDW